MHILLARTFIKYRFKDLLYSQILVLFTYITINNEGVYKNSILYHELKEAYISRTILKIRRFQSIASYESYLRSISLKNISPIFNIVRGLKKLSNPVVRAKIKRQVKAKDNIKRSKIREKQVISIVKQFKITFKLLQAKEIE